MKLRPRALCVAVCLAFPLSSAAAQQSCDNSPSQIPTLLTVEGGGSLGVYEAGMTFTLVETFKRKWLGNANRTLDRLPPLCLSIATGASAGSINAFIAATNWCDARLTALPEESTFWRTWVTTGIMQLLPIRGEEESPDSAVFARRHFDDYIEPELRKAWRNANWVNNCHVEFGATATRVYADTLPAIGGLGARNQRLAFALTVQGIDTSGEPIVQQYLPRTRLQRGSFGSLNTLPAVRGDVVRWKSVFDLLKASSSFPVAFQPLELNYCTYPDADRGQPEACGKRALMLDGGVFDNAPLSLTYLLSFSHDLDTKPTMLLFLTPGRMRVWAEGIGRDVAREPPHAAAGTSPYGLEQLAQLVGEMIPTAREYELQIAGRVVPMELYLRLTEPDRQRIVQQQGRPTKSPAVPMVTDAPTTVDQVASSLSRDFYTTARWHPLTGDWLGGFGAFLGRPLREYDFYVGVYDAMVLLAENILCAELRLRVYTLHDATAAGPYRDCVGREVDTLIARPPFPLSGVASRTLKALHHDEFNRGRGGQPLARNVAARMTLEDSTFIVVDAVREALRDARVTDTSTAKKPHWYSPRSLLAARHCAKLGVANAMFCNSKLVAFFDSLDTDRAARRILLHWADEGECSVRRSFASRNALQVTNAWKQPDKCRVEQSFVNTMRDPEGNLYELSRQVLGRLSDRTPRGGMGSASSALFYLHATVGDRHRRQADIGRSTIPLDAPKKTLYYLLPSSWGLTPNIRGLGEIGWEARRHLWATPLALAFPLHVRPRSQIGTDGARDHLLVVPGARLEHKALFLSTRAGFQADFWCRPSDGLERCYKGYTPGAYVSVFGKVNVSFTKVPRGLPEYRKQNTSILTFGIGDLNGLAYWMLHK